MTASERIREARQAQEGVTMALPLDWNEWREEWNSWVAEHENDLQPTRGMLIHKDVRAIGITYGIGVDGHGTVVHSFAELEQELGL